MSVPFCELHERLRRVWACAACGRVWCGRTCPGPAPVRVRWRTQVLPGADRHPCVPADREGTHMRDAAGRSAFVQQVLHAVALMARDRSGWADTPWAVLRKLDPDHRANVCSH